MDLTQDVKKESYNHHDGGKLFFIKKVTHSKQKDVLVKNSNLFDKNCIQTRERHMP